jgi:hypothetical protein
MIFGKVVAAFTGSFDSGDSDFAERSEEILKKSLLSTARRRL